MFVAVSVSVRMALEIARGSSLSSGLGDQIQCHAQTVFAVERPPVIELGVRGTSDRLR